MYKTKGISFDTSVAVKKLKSIFSITMIAVLLFSSVGFSVNRHYCMGMLMDESFYSIADGCGMESDDTCEEPAESFDLGCCDDENLALAGIDVISFSKKQKDLLCVNIVQQSFTYVAAQPQTTNRKPFTFFPPPEPLPYGRDLLVQVQRFLI